MGVRRKAQGTRQKVLRIFLVDCKNMFEDSKHKIENQYPYPLVRGTSWLGLIPSSLGGELSDACFGVHTGDQRLGKPDALYLYSKVDLITLGRLANQKRQDLHGNKTCYVKNLHIDYSNICTSQCLICAYARKKNEAGAFEKTVEDVLSLVRIHAEDISQVHIVGGHHPDLPYEYYLSLIKTIRDEFPKMHIKAFTAIEIKYFADKFGKTISQVLEDFIGCGLNSLPGGGAEILVDEVRKKICPQKGLSQIWLDVHKQAHELGITSTATMLFGHVETVADRITHMEKIRRLQDETQGFTAFIPLPFHPANTQFSHLSQVTAHEILKTISLSRLYLDNISHIKAYWTMLGLPLAQLAQHFGADDLHGTVIQENISHMAGSKSPQGCAAADLEVFIRAAGYEPVLIA